MKASAWPPVREPKARELERLKASNDQLLRTLQIVEESRALLADQYDFAPLGLLTLDARGCIRDMNLTAAKFLGRERSNLLGLPFLSYAAKSDWKIFLNHLRDCRSRGTKVVSNLLLRIRDGGTLQVELTSVPVLDARRGDTVYRTVITDITERINAGKALSESEERYRDLVERSPDGILIVIDGLIAFANRAAIAFCGVEEGKELTNRKLTDLISRADQRAVMEMLGKESLESDSVSALEVQLMQPNRSARDVELTARSYIYEGESAVLVVVRDIARRKRAEREVLTISERERSGFGRDLHDSLCQSLIGAAFMADTLRKQVAEISLPAAAAAEHIAKVIRHCGDEARSLARGLCPVNMEQSGLVAALYELTADLRSRLHVDCTLECDEQLTIQDTVVATNLYRIVQEATSNAIKHGKAKAILIQFTAAQGKITLNVRDNGRGLPARPKQNGMGLHTMQYRATMIGGSLEVRRDRPSGTVVTCSFPAHGAMP